MTQIGELEIYKKFLKQDLLCILDEIYGQEYTDSLSDDTLNRIIDLFECWQDNSIANNLTWNDAIDTVLGK